MIETGPRGNPSWREKASQTEHGPAEAVPGRQCWVDFVELESLLVNFNKKNYIHDDSKMNGCALYCTEY